MKSVVVSVKLFGTLRDRVSGGYDHEKGMKASLREGATIQDLLHAIGLSEKEAGFFVVNGVSKKLMDGLSDRDEISIFLFLAGG
jgi:molybdopterin converting factor small subunit